MNESKSAAIYAPCLSPDGAAALKQFLLAQDLYISDHTDEQPQDLNLPAHLRPQFVRRLMHLRDDWASTLVIDHLSSLGQSLPEQLAVLGYLLDLDVPVLMDGRPQGSVYQFRVKALSENENAEMWQARSQLEAWPDHRDAVLTDGYGNPLLAVQAFLPDTIAPTDRYSYGEACLLADSHVRDGLSVKAISQELRVEGYRNKQGRHIWYYENAQQAALDTTAQQSALAGRESRAQEQEELEASVAGQHPTSGSATVDGGEHL